MTYDDLLNLDDIDLVWIVSPTKEHVMMIQAAVQAGKHVFCEKPIGRTVEEVSNIDSVPSVKAERCFPFYLWFLRHEFFRLNRSTSYHIATQTK